MASFDSYFCHRSADKAEQTNLAVVSCKSVGQQAPLPFPIEASHCLWFPPVIDFATLLMSNVSAPTPGATSSDGDGKFHKELREHMAERCRMIRHQDCKPLGKPKPSAQMQRRCKLYRFCVCRLPRLVVFREELIVIFRTWFRPRTSLRKALDNAYLIFELCSDTERTLFYHIGISNLLTYSMSLTYLELDTDPFNQQLAKDCGHIALRACPQDQVELASGDVWKQLGISTVPASFAAINLDAAWAIRPTTIALGEGIRDPFRPCEVEVEYVGEAKSFWWPYSGIEEADAVPDQADDADNEGFDETDDSDGDQGEDTEGDSEHDGIINPADEEPQEPLEDAGKPRSGRARQPAWRRRVQRGINRVSSSAMAEQEPDHDGYGTGSDVDVLDGPGECGVAGARGDAPSVGDATGAAEPQEMYLILDFHDLA